ncbi:MAG TPA: hypothetical protein VFY51_03395, partial [Pyrinomonadaceae bacterium]|nr:hypothetical protein [Pyrinomonadaceae bacterium]
MTKRIVLILFIFAALGVAVWAAFRFVRPKWQGRHGDQSAQVTSEAPPVTWDVAAEEVKADRGEPAGVNARVETPPELKHYEERHWFLATQVAEVAKHRVHSVQDYMDLAAMIQRGEMVIVPALTDSYILFGIGERATEEAFSRYAGDRSIELYNESQLKDAYKQLDEKRTRLEAEISSLKKQATKLSRRERTKQRELQQQLSARESELGSVREDKTELDEVYADAETRQRMFHDYESLQLLAKNFNGRSFDLNNSADR